MATHSRRAAALIAQALEKKTLSDLKKQLAPKMSPQRRLPSGNDKKLVQQRWQALDADQATKSALGSTTAADQAKTYSKNIENFLGTVTVPVGLAGPLRVNGLFAQGDYLIPLATTEAALVASYNRGAKIISEAGGCTVMQFNAHMSRCPVFAFSNLIEVGEFLVWLNENLEAIKKRAESTTKFGKIIEIRYSVEGNRVFMGFDYQTGDAAGQNMVTIATQAACEFIKSKSPVKPKYFFVEGNISGDKKASMMAVQHTRGRKVVAEVILSAKDVEKKLHTTVDMLCAGWATGAVGASLIGAIGIQGHYANALTALFIACGQDVACVSESAVGITLFEKTSSGDLYASVTLPNLIVGTVGGGTGLPAQKACLEIMGLFGDGKANALAEVAAGLCLAGEISIAAAMCSNTFTQAHLLLARAGAILGRN